MRYAWSSFRQKSFVSNDRSRASIIQWYFIYQMIGLTRSLAKHGFFVFASNIFRSQNEKCLIQEIPNPWRSNVRAHGGILLDIYARAVFGARPESKTERLRANKKVVPERTQAKTTLNMPPHRPRHVRSA